MVFTLSVLKVLPLPFVENFHDSLKICKNLKAFLSGCFCRMVYNKVETVNGWVSGQMRSFFHLKISVFILW